MMKNMMKNIKRTKAHDKVHPTHDRSNGHGNDTKPGAMTRRDESESSLSQRAPKKKSNNSNSNTANKAIKFLVQLHQKVALDVALTKGLRAQQHQQQQITPSTEVGWDRVTEEPGQDRRIAIGNDTYSLEDELGEGGFGQVFLGREVSHANANVKQMVVAIKRQAIRPYDDDDSDDSGDTNAEWQKRAELECALLQTHGHHPNIVAFHATGQSCDNNIIYLVMEKATMDLTALTDHAENTHLFRQQPDLRQQIMRGILTATEYLHERGIAHMDLKPQNILIQTTAIFRRSCHDSDSRHPTNNHFRLRDGRRIEASDIRVCDFGLAHVSPQYDPRDTTCTTTKRRGGSSWRDHGWARKHDIVMTRSCGTDGYMAPELYCSNSQSQLSFCYEARRADMWSVGCILLPLCVGMIFRLEELTKASSPFRRNRQSFLNSCWGNDILQEEEATLLYDLLFRHLLPLNAWERSSSKKSLKHPWFKYTSDGKCS